MLHKIWYIKVEEREEGPYSIRDLKKHPSMTPDTLVRKEGYKDWIPARNVPELKVLFEDEREAPVDLQDTFKIKPVPNEEAALTIEGSNFPFLFFWLLILVLILSYLFFQLRGL